MTLVTVENPFPLRNEHWLMHPKKTAKVAVIEFLMEDTKLAQAKGLIVALFQDKGNLHIISFHVSAYSGFWRYTTTGYLNRKCLFRQLTAKLTKSCL